MDGLPGVRDTLERWQLIPKGSGREAAAELGITVRKVVESSSDPIEACLEYVYRNTRTGSGSALRLRATRLR